MPHLENPRWFHDVCDPGEERCKEAHGWVGGRHGRATLMQVNFRPRCSRNGTGSKHRHVQKWFLYAQNSSKFNFNGEIISDNIRKFGVAFFFRIACGITKKNGFHVSRSPCEVQTGPWAITHEGLKTAECNWACQAVYFSYQQNIVKQ